MNVHDVNFGPHRPDQLRRSTVEHGGKVSSGAKEEVQAPEAVRPTDRLELSEAARRASAEQDELKREVEFARRAMYSIPPLSEERAQELLDRLERGQYNAPDVLLKLSERLTNDLAPLSTEADGSESE